MVSSLHSRGDGSRKLSGDGPAYKIVSIGVQSRPTSARYSAKPSGTTLRCAPPALALRRHNLEGGQLFDADPGQSFGTV